MQSDKNNDILDAHIVPCSGLCPHGTKYRDIVDPIVTENKIQQLYTLLFHNIVKSFSDKIFNAKLLRNEQHFVQVFFNRLYYDYFGNTFIISPVM